jgi:hypothetical protein
VKWPDIEPTLEEASCDVAIILTCCHAANAALGARRGTNEVLAACSREGETMSGPDSYIRVLIVKLQSFGGEPFTLLELHNRIDNAWVDRLSATPFWKILAINISGLSS